MDNYSSNGSGFSQLAEYETPFADTALAREEEDRNYESSTYRNQYAPEMESPFSRSYETPTTSTEASPMAGEFVQFIGELNDHEFANSLYELATELEDSWNSKISNEVAMGQNFTPFTMQQAQEYFEPLASETESMIDKVSEYFSGRNFADHSEAEVERFFTEMEFNHSRLSPVQEQFFGSIFKKVKSVVSKGIDLAKKGISVVGKILPMGLVLDKLKGLIRPLLDRVLKFAIGKLPAALQPHAQALAKKFLNLETVGEVVSNEEEIPATGELESIQSELDTHIAKLVMSDNESEAEQSIAEYESTPDSLQREMSYETGSPNLPSLDTAREQFINELKQIKDGESAAPAIERFIPAVIMALRPVVKIALKIIGRQKVINFLAEMLAKLVGKYVPHNVAQPLAASIIDVGMSAIGFETYETSKADVAYEAIANTIQETVQNLGELNEATINDREVLTAQMLEAFETAAANNFPSQYIKPELRKSSIPATWVLKPRKGPKHYYKKYTRVFSVTIDPQTAKTITTFRGIPLANFLKDKLGLDPSKPVEAKVHLYESIQGTWLSRINKYENVPGLGRSQRLGWVQFHPLSEQAAALLLKESGLGKNFSQRYTTYRHRIAVGQRFYYLEINGARLLIPPYEQRNHKHEGNKGSDYVSEAHSGDVQCVINFIKSEVRFNYYFSEEEAKSVVEKLNKNDFLGAAITVRNSVRNVLNGILLKNVSNKVKIIHEAVPELYLENYVEQQQFAPLAALGRAVGGVALSAGKEVLTKLIEKIVDKLSELAYQAVVNYFKARAAEFKNAQAEPKDGVTVKIIWVNIPGMSTIRTVINAIKGNLSVGNLSDLVLPNIPTPDVQVSAGKNFD